MNTTIIVKSLDKPNWARRSRYAKCHDTIIANRGRNGYNTGLSEEEQLKLEQELGHEKGTLAPHSPFWKEYGVTMTDKPLRLNLENAQDRLDYAILKASLRVANSLGEKNKWPKAEYIIHDMEEDAKRENETIDIEAQAIHDFIELSVEGQRDYLKLLGKHADSMSNTVVRNTLFKIAKNTPVEFNRITNMGDRKTRLLLFNLLAARILNSKGGHYYYQDIPLGHGEEAAIAYLDDIKNQDLKLVLLGKLENKTKQTTKNKD